jgi:hypothetical protein
MKQRMKLCEVCKIDFSTMYRVQYKNPKEWVFVYKECLAVFVCRDCLLHLKKDNSAYKYGGTWKK